MRSDNLWNWSGSKKMLEVMEKVKLEQNINVLNGLMKGHQQ